MRNFAKIKSLANFGREAMALCTYCVPLYTFILALFFLNWKGGTKTKLTKNEKQVLYLIPSGADTIITRREISNITGLTLRRIDETISRLIINYHIPIVSDRQRGYYIATTEQERARGMSGFNNQIKYMQKRAQAVFESDLNNWKKEVLEKWVMLIYKISYQISAIMNY